jgi:hypothetical protein
MRISLFCVFMAVLAGCGKPPALIHPDVIEAKMGDYPLPPGKSAAAKLVVRRDMKINNNIFITTAGETINMITAAGPGSGGTAGSVPSYAQHSPIFFFPAPQPEPLRGAPR